MGLIKSIVFENGIECPQAYIKICDVRLDYVNNRAWIEVNIYNNKASCDKKLKPVLNDPLKMYDINIKDSSQSSFIINIKELVSDSADNIILSFKNIRIELIANVDFSTDSNYIENIINSINNGEMNKYIIAESSNTFDDANKNNIIIKAKKDSYTDGCLGDNINIHGSSINSISLTTTGEDSIPGDFTKYFIIPYENNKSTNIRKQGYLYMKTLPAYINCEDDEIIN